MPRLIPVEEKGRIREKSRVAMWVLSLFTPWRALDPRWPGRILPDVANMAGPL